jgi:hypothetical protein
MQDWEAAGEHSQQAVSRFFLVDSNGHKTLAVSGQEGPDGRYVYRSEPALEQFGTLECRAREDVFSWLENILKRSTVSGDEPAMEPAAEPAEERAALAGFDEHLVFVRYQCASTHCLRFQELSHNILSAVCL